MAPWRPSLWCSGQSHPGECGGPHATLQTTTGALNRAIARPLVDGTISSLVIDKATYFVELFGKWRLRRALSTARGPWPPWTTPRRARTTASSTESYHIAHIDEKGFWVCCDTRPRRPRSAPTHTPHPATTPKNLFLHPEPRSQPHIMSWAAWHQTLHNLRSTHLIHAHEFINSTK